MAQFQEQAERIETLLARFDSFSPATGARADADELVRTISGLYGDGLRLILETIRSELGEAAQPVLERCCADPLVASLLITHGLHPVPLQERVARAVDSVRPYLRSHGGEVDVLHVDEDAVELRLRGSCDGCTASQATLKTALERAIFEAAPEVLEVRAAETAAAPHAPPVDPALLPSIV